MMMMMYNNILNLMCVQGQGVILERSPFSDMVFMEAMYKQGYIRKQCE